MIDSQISKQRLNPAHLEGVPILLLLMLISPPAQAITWCHDYSYYVITGGQDFNNLPPNKLRDELKKRGYELVGTFTPASGDEASQLKNGDVLIFGEDHSGVVVDDGGHINHFIQPFIPNADERNRYYQERQGRSAEQIFNELDPEFNQTLLRRANTLEQLRAARPIYKNKPMQVWRKNEDKLKAIQQCQAELETGRKIQPRLNESRKNIVNATAERDRQLAVCRQAVTSAEQTLQQVQPVLDRAAKVQAGVAEAERRLPKWQAAHDQIVSSWDALSKAVDEACVSSDPSDIGTPAKGLEEVSSRVGTAWLNYLSAWDNAMSEAAFTPEALLPAAEELISGAGQLENFRNAPFDEWQQKSQTALQQAQTAAGECRKAQTVLREDWDALALMNTRTRAVLQPYLEDENAQACVNAIAQLATGGEPPPAESCDIAQSASKACTQSVWEQVPSTKSLAAVDLKALAARTQNVINKWEALNRNLAERKLEQATKLSERSTACLRKLGESEELVTVPNLAVFGSAEEMKAVLKHAGLEPAFAAADSETPSKEMEFKLQRQSPAPDTKAPKGSVVTLSIYPKFGSQTTDETAAGTMPNVVGKTLDAATEIIWAAGLEPSGVVSGIKPPDAAHAYLVSGTTPPPGTPIDPNNKPYIEIRVYGTYEGSAQPPAAEQPVSDPMVGMWVGKCTLPTGGYSTLLGPDKTAPFYLSISKRGDKLQVDPHPADAQLGVQLTYNFDGTHVIATSTKDQGVRGEIRDFTLQGDKMVGTYTSFDNYHHSREVLNCELQKRVITAETEQALKKMLAEGKSIF